MAYLHTTRLQRAIVWTPSAPRRSRRVDRCGGHEKQYKPTIGMQIVLVTIMAVFTKYSQQHGVRWVDIPSRKELWERLFLREAINASS